MFVGAVVLLLLNDWLLKPAIGNWFTGKLSDFAGLFAFAWFWIALMPRRRSAVVAVSAVAFVLWKSPLSEGLLEGWNEIGLWPLHRVVDYTDWLALTVLPAAHRLAGRVPRARRVASAKLPRRPRAIATATLAVLAFAATSVPMPEHDLTDATTYVLRWSRSEVSAAVRSLGLNHWDRTLRKSGPDQPGIPDTIMVWIRHPPERTVGVTFELHDAGEDETLIRLLSASTGGPPPTIEPLRRAFEEQVVGPVRERLAQRTPPAPATGDSADRTSGVHRQVSRLVRPARQRRQTVDSRV